MDTLFPAERHRRPRIPPAGHPGPAAARSRGGTGLAGCANAPALVAAAAHAAAHGWPGHATRLAATLSRYLHSGGHFPEAITVFSHALDAARRTGDRAAEATALTRSATSTGSKAAFSRPPTTTGRRWPCSVRQATGPVRLARWAT